MKKAQQPFPCLKSKGFQSTVASTGQAAGESAVLSVNRSLNATRVSIWLIQDEFIRNKAMSCPYLDGLATYAQLECLDKLVVPDLFNGQDILFNWTEVRLQIHNLE